MGDYRQFCGLAVALDIVGDRWNLLIVRELLLGPRRFGQLRANLPGAASNLVTARLRELESAGIIARDEEPDRKAVVYSLTPTGEGLREAVHALIRWGAQFMAAGPRTGDTVRGEWIGLAASALLEEQPLVQLESKSTPDGHMRLALHTTDDRTAAVTGPPAAVLGVVAGALPPARATALGVSIDDADHALASLIPAAPDRADPAAHAPRATTTRHGRAAS